MDDHKMLNPDETQALFRYRLIAPLLDPLASEEEKRAWRWEVIAKEQLFPDGSRRRVGERTLRRWVAWYRAAGWHGLIPPSRRDKGSLRKATPDLLERAKVLKQEDPRRSVPQVLRLLHAEGFPAERLPHHGTLWRHLAREGLGSRQRPEKKGLRRFEREVPGDLWQADVKYGPYLPDPEHAERMRRTYLVAFLDDHSRFIAHAAFYWAEDIYALELCFQQAILRRGLPRRVYVDNGGIFQSRVFTLACAQLGVRHLSTRPYQPESKGKVERLFRTIDEEVLHELEHRPVATLDELNARFWAWIEEVYHRRVHSQTKQTPLSRFVAGPPLERVSPERLAEVFLWRVQRGVDKTGLVQFEGNLYQAPPGWERRRRVQIRFHPLHLERLYLYEGDRRVGELVSAQVTHFAHPNVNARHRLGEESPGEASSYLEHLLEQNQARRQQLLSPLRLATKGDE